MHHRRPSSDAMSRTDSLPALSERGRGLAELKGMDPMDRRLEVEKKERYAQALREQMAMNAANRGSAANRGVTPERESLGGTPHWGLSGAASAVGLPVPPSSGGGGSFSGCGGSLPPGLPPAMESPPGSNRRSRGSTPLVHDHTAHTADRLAEVQDVMRQRLQMLQEEQQRQWQNVQAALNQQLTSVRDAADAAVQKHLASAKEEHANELRKVLGELNAARRECAASAQHADGLAQDLSALRQQVLGEINAARRESAASAQHAEGLAQDLSALRQQVEQLRLQSNDHRIQLDVHTEEIERLKVSHEECVRFRAEMLRDQRSLNDAVAQLGANMKEVAKREEELARRLGDVPAQIKRLRDEVPRIAARAAQDLLERQRPPEPAPSPPPAQPLFLPEVSEEAFALLRNADGELYELPELRNVVGRGASCNVCISSSQAISNRHASVDIDREGKSSLKDLGSRNGTFLNDRRVPQDAGFVIKSGDSVRLGVDGPTYVFEYGPAYYARWPQEPERVRLAGRAGR